MNHKKDFLAVLPIQSDKGKKWRIDGHQLGLEIWVPDGWKYDLEPESPETEAAGRAMQPIFYRETEPHGELRVNIIRPADVQTTPKEKASRWVEHRQKDPKSENIQLTDNAKRSIVSWLQRIDDRTASDHWLIFERKGIIGVTFTHPTYLPATTTLDAEIQEAGEIARRIIIL